MLVAEEDGLSHKLLYSRVKFPDARGLGLKALCIQFGKDKPLPAGQQAAAAGTEYTTPEELFQALPKRRPLGEGQSLIEVEGKPGTFRPNDFAWSSFEMEEASLYFTTILSKQHRKILKTNFEELQKISGRKQLHKRRRETKSWPQIGKTVGSSADESCL